MVEIENEDAPPLAGREAGVGNDAEERDEAGAAAPTRKRALRADLTRRRAGAAAATPHAGVLLAGHAAELDHARIVAAYVAMRSEIDPLPLAFAMRERGSMLALPRISDGPAGAKNKRGAMGFALWDEGARLVDGPFGTREPVGEAVTPDLLLVPLLGFTRRGDRLGYGGGYYDRWLWANPSARAIGVAYAAQEVAHLPVEAHDARLAMVLTEHERIVCRAPS